MSAKQAFLTVVNVLLLLVARAALAQDAGTLQAKYDALRPQLAKSDFGRPVVLNSSASDDDVRGEIYAVLAHPFGIAGPALGRLNQWCAILILPVNTKQCGVSGSPSTGMLTLAIGRKFDTNLDHAYTLAFHYQLSALHPQYLRLVLHADTGPFGTHDYRMILEATPVGDAKTFLHFTYSYSFGVVARIGMQFYLHTSGRDKVGFTVVGRGHDGTPQLVRGVRGVIERNVMRYFLAIDAYLDSLALPAGQRTDARLREWYAGIERYPAQLHELDLETYLQLKQGEVTKKEATRGWPHRGAIVREGMDGSWGSGHSP